jgi:hypothetical protein
MPAMAQSLNPDTSSYSSFIRDRHGNVMASNFKIKKEGAVLSRMEHLQNQKIAFYTTAIRLTPQEAERFWPLYNEYYQKKEEVFRRKEMLAQQLSASLAHSSEIATEKNIKMLLDAYLNCIEKEGALHLEYYQKLLGVLPVRKIARYYLAEDRFKQWLLENISGRGDNKQTQTPSSLSFPY